MTKGELIEAMKDAPDEASILMKTTDGWKHPASVEYSTEKQTFINGVGRTDLARLKTSHTVTIKG